MRHFDVVDDEEAHRLFELLPEDFTPDSEPAVLGAALGATLYIPGDRPDLARALARQRAAGALSVVVCLEDAVPDAAVAAAERATVEGLRAHARTRPDGPLVFVRVRSAAQARRVLDGLGGEAGVLTGLVLPKFGPETGRVLLEEVLAASERVGRRLLVMPVLETPEVIHAEYRTQALLEAHRLLDKHRDHVLAVRVGATDLSAVYGLRRDRGTTAYDLRVVGEAIAAVVNVFGRADGSAFPVCGPVWEHFAPAHSKPPSGAGQRRRRAEWLARELEGLVREVGLDRANGLSGKTVIHPSHVAVVHALSVVTAEDYRDAVDVLGTGARGGAAASSSRNKMNESKPHSAWARRVLLRSRAFGVARPSTSFLDLLAAGLPA